MQFEPIPLENGTLLVVSGDGVLISNATAAAELLLSASHTYHSNALIMAKESIADDFFVLSSGLAGDVLQKFINYGGKLAIYGDFSHYTSKPLQDFMRESNRGKDIFFATNKEDAIAKLRHVL